jgi:hypothetical protein
MMKLTQPTYPLLAVTFGFMKARFGLLTRLANAQHACIHQAIVVAESRAKIVIYILVADQGSALGRQRREGTSEPAETSDLVKESV